MSRLAFKVAVTVICISIFMALHEFFNSVDVIGTTFMSLEELNDGITARNGTSVRLSCSSEFMESINEFHNGKMFRRLQIGTSKCHNLSRPITRREHSPWQRNEENQHVIYLYSAFFDDRPALGVTAFIRIFGVASLSIRNISMSAVYCHLWYNGCQSPYVVQSELNLLGREKGYMLNNVTYLQYMFSCRLPGTQPIPSHVSIVTSAECSESNIYLPIEKPIRSDPDHTFGVCVAIAFGIVPVPEFVEWVELNRILGVTEFNIYDAGLENMSAALNYYTKRKIIKLHRMPPPIQVNTSHHEYTGEKLDSIKLSSPASLNDCLLRNVYRYRYAVIIDFDEVIVPRRHVNYHWLLKEIEQSFHVIEPHTITFANTYFFLDFEVDEKQPAVLKTARRRLRAAPSPIDSAPKSFVDPRTCLSVYNHFCYNPLRARYSEPPHFDVPTDLGRSHHYRKCGFGEQKCSKLFSEKMRDDIMLRFKRKLLPSVLQVLEAIGYKILRR